MKKALLVRRVLTFGLALMAFVPEVGAQSSNEKIRRINPVQLRMEQEHNETLALEQERKVKAEAKMAKLKAEAEQKQKESQLFSSPGYAAHQAVKLPKSKLSSLTRAADGVTLLDSIVSVNADGTNSWKEIYSYDNNGYQLGYIYSYFDKEWIESQKWKYEYDEDGNRNAEAYYYKRDGEWIPSSKSVSASKVVNGETKTIKDAYYNSWDESINNWRGSYYNEYDYDDNGHQTLEISLNDWDEENHCWSSGNKDENEYDENGNHTLYISYIWDSSTASWQGNKKLENEYDKDNNVTKVTSYSWNNNEWVKLYIEYLTFNEKDYEASSEVHYYDSNGNETEKEEYTYEYTFDDKTGKILETITKLNGENYKKSIFQFDEKTQEVTFYETYSWNGSEWIGNYKEEYEYDSNGNQTLAQWLSWNTEKNKWIGGDKYVRNYVTINGSQYNTLYETYSGYDDNDNWIGDSKSEYKFDDSGRYLEELAYGWDDDNAQWICAIKCEYEYSDNGNVVTYYYWDENAQNWIGMNKYESALDNQGNQTLSAQYYWDSTTNEWIGSYKRCYEWNNMGYITLYSYSNKWNSTTKNFIPSYTYEYEYNADGLTSYFKFYLYTNGTDKYLQSIATYYYSLHDTAIESITTDGTGNNSQVRIFDIQGRPRTSLAKGINIIKSNGKTIKVVK